MIRHIVALRFKAGTTAAEKEVLYRTLEDLGQHIDGILGFRSFQNVSIELPVVRGFSDLFWFDFRDIAVRDAYLIHPAHQAAGARLVAAMEGGAEGIFVFDVEV
jgi:hypothetical protein